MAYKHDYDKILTRLMTILTRLNDGGKLDADELSNEFNVSKKTILRDLNERLVSFPIYKENKKWKMQKGFKIEKIRSLEEQLILDIIEKMTEGVGGGFATKSKKLLSKIKNDDFNPIYTKLNIEDITEKFNDIKLIEEAIKEHKELKCTYENSSKGSFNTIIQPLKIVNYEGFWYLVALHDGKVKKFYLKELSNLQITQTTFEPNDDIEQLLDNSISIWFQEDIEPFEVKLHADKIIAKYFQRRTLPTQKIDTFYSDGSIDFTVTITYEMEIIPIVKYWLPHLQILEPEWVAEIVDEDIDEYLKNRT